MVGYWNDKLILWPSTKRYIGRHCRGRL